MSRLTRPVSRLIWVARHWALAHEASAVCERRAIRDSDAKGQMGLTYTNIVVHTVDAWLANCDTECRPIT